MTLLLLRWFVGALAALAGGACLAGSEPPQSFATFAASLLLLTGPLLIVGVCTPILGVVVALIGLATALSWPPLAALALDSELARFELVALACVLAAMGPGAYSLDAQLFGRRELAIRGPKRGEEDLSD